MDKEAQQNDEKLLVSHHMMKSASVASHYDKQQGKKGNAFGKTSWIRVAFSMMASQVGGGLLGLPFAFQQLGWIPSILTLVLGCFVTWYTALCMYRVFLQNPHILSYGDAFAVYFPRSPFMLKYCNATVTLLLILNITSSVIVGGSSLHHLTSVFDVGSSSDSDSACLVSWTIPLIALAFWLGSQFRIMSELAWLSVLSILSFMISIFANLIGILEQNDLEGSSSTNTATSSFASSGFETIVQSCLAMLFAFTGHLVFFEFIASLEKPTDFPKCIACSQIFALTCFATFGCIIYSFSGTNPNIKSPVNLSLDEGSTLDYLSSVPVILHVVLAAPVYVSFTTNLIKEMFEQCGLLRNRSHGKDGDDILSGSSYSSSSGRPRRRSSAIFRTSSVLLETEEEIHDEQLALRPSSNLQHGSASSLNGGDYNFSDGENADQLAHESISCISWAALTFFVLCVAVGLALAIPSFFNYTALATALVASQTTFLWPLLLEYRDTTSRIDTTAASSWAKINVRNLIRWGCIIVGLFILCGGTYTSIKGLEKNHGC